MRLLVVSQYFWPENFRINDLVSELVKRGHDVTVLTGKPNYPEGKIFPEFLKNPKQFVEYRGAKIMRVPLLSRGTGRGIRLLLNYLSYAFSASFFGFLKLRKQKFDVVFVFEPSPVTVGLPAVLFRKLKKWPVVFWVLDQWPETLSAIGVVKSNFILRQVGRLVAFIYKRCDLILSPSKSLIPQIVQYCEGSHRVVYFPNWVEDVYNINTLVAAPEVPLQNGSFNIMFAGNIGEAQDFSSILEAAERLKEYSHIRWLILGDGRMSQYVKEEVTRRGLEMNVILLGRYPIERMPSFFKHAQVLLVSLKPDPIFSMTIPGKMQSYLAYGLPIIAMLDGEGAKVIEEANAGYVAPAGNSGKLAELVLRMSLLTDAERFQMGLNGKTYSHQEFDRDTLIARLETWLLKTR